MFADKVTTDHVFRLIGDLQGESRIFTLENGDNSIGTDPASTVYIPVRQVSRQHAVIHVDSKGIRLQDLGSTNGTFVNGVRVRKARLDTNDWVQFGPVLLTLESLPVSDHELAIELNHEEKEPNRLDDCEGITTEIGIPAKASITWAATLERCASMLISRWSPDVEGAMAHFADAFDGSTVALLTRASSGGVVVNTASGNLVELDDWKRPEAFESLRPARISAPTITAHELSSASPASAAISWGEATWDAALVVAGAEINRSELGFLELALRLFQSATVPVPENGKAAEPPTEGDLVFPSWHVKGRTPAMLDLYRQLTTLLKSSIPVLVTGETGVGKEHVIRILHSSSNRASGPLQIVNCTAIPADLLEAELFGIEAGVATGVTRRTGKLRLANGGILFLDEIGDMDPTLQAKLLRALQEGEVHPLGAASPITVNVRVVAATNTNLEKRVGDGQFRKDLFYRIAGCEVQVPPLRQRREDIPALCHYFLDRAAKENAKSIRGLSIGALEALQAAAWPGNVRQLQRELTRLVTSCPSGQTIESSMISPAILAETVSDDHELDNDDLDLKVKLESVEKSLILRALDKAQGNHSEAARLLGVTRNGLSMKVKRLGINRDPK